MSDELEETKKDYHFYNEIIGEQEREIEELKLKLIQSRAEYLNTLDENPDCSAWTLDELPIEKQIILMRDATETLKIEEPLLMIEMIEKDKQIQKLKIGLMMLSEKVTDMQLIFQNLEEGK